MTVTMKELETRLDALDGRVAALEDAAGTAEPVGPTQDERNAADRVLLNRFATNRDEAIAQQAARERLAEQGLVDAHGRPKDPEPAEGDDEAPEVPPAVVTEA